MSRKMKALVAMALTALAFAIPAASASANWEMVGSGEVTNTEIWHLTGTVQFQQGAPTFAGVHCHVTIEVSLHPNSREGEVTSFEVANPTSECFGLGVLSTCVVHSAVMHGNIQVEAQAPGTKEIVLSGLVVTFTTSGETAVHTPCPGEFGLVQEAGDAISIEVDNAAEVTEGAVTGTVNGGSGVFSGEVTSIPAGTFGWS